MAKGCSQCLKVFVILINTFFLLIGLAILALALFLYFDTNVRAMKESTGFRMQIDIALFITMGVGGLTVLVSGFGCCGAYHESTCLLSTFCAIVILVCCVEIGGSIFLFIQRSDPVVKTTVYSAIRSSIRNVNETTVPQHIKILQQSLRCCGVNGTDDYDKATGSAVCKSNDGSTFFEGCAAKLLKFIEENALWALIAILGVAVLELLCMILAVSLCCAVKREEDGYMGVSVE